MKEFLEGNGSTLDAYGGGIISHFGNVWLPCQYNKRKFKCKFFLVDVDGPMLLGLPTGEALGIIKINVIDEVTEKAPPHKQGPNSESNMYVDRAVPIEQRPAIQSKEDLKKMYPECFDPNEKFFKDYHYEIRCDPAVEPKVDPPRRVPIELRDKLKTKLDVMEKRGIIAKVCEPTKWVSSLLISTKPNGELRICLDPVNLNKAVRRDHHPTPVIDDITPELSGSDFFYKIRSQGWLLACETHGRVFISNHFQYTFRQISFSACAVWFKNVSRCFPIQDRRNVWSMSRYNRDF